MNKIRIGLFETNSSSTHSCVICKGSDYSKWVSGEYAYMVYPNMVTELAEKYKVENSIHGNFIEVEALKEIPFSSIFEYGYSSTKDDIKEECKNFSIYDAYKLLLDAADSNWKDAWEEFCEDPVYYDEEDKKTVKLVDCIKAICYNAEELTSQVLFDVLYESGLCTVDKISDGWSTKQYITKENLDGMEVVSVAEYGND